MAATIYVKRIENKMNMLKEDRDVLHQVLDDYVNIVLSEAKAWIDRSEKQQRSYREICALIEECSIFVTEKSGEIAVALGNKDNDGTNDTVTSPGDSSTAATPTSFPFLSSFTNTDSHSVKMTERLEQLENDRVRLEKQITEVASVKLEAISVKVEALDNHSMKMKERIDKLETDRVRLEKQVTEVGGVKLEAIAVKVEALEKQPQPIACTARVPVGAICIVSANHRLNIFTDICTNAGGCFNSASGEFIAPVDGSYLTGITHTPQSGAVHLQVCLFRASSRAEVVVCNSFNETGYRIGSGEMCVVNLQKGDKLYVRAATWNGQVKHPTSFSCLLIG